MLEDALKEQGIDVFKANEGFFTYKAVEEDGVKIYQILSTFLTPECRNTDGSQYLFEAFEVQSRQEGAKLVAWSAEMKDPNKESHLLICLHLGFKIQSADAQRLVLLKQV